MNVALDVHVLGPTKEQVEQRMQGEPNWVPWVSVHFDPKQARHVYDMATLYEGEEDVEGHIVLLVANDLGKLVEVPADECVVHHPFLGCVFDGCYRDIGPYAGVNRSEMRRSEKTA